MFRLKSPLCLILLLLALSLAVQSSRAWRLSKRSIEDLQDDCFDRCSHRHPGQVGAFAFAMALMSGQFRQLRGPFWDCFGKCMCSQAGRSPPKGKGAKCW